MDVKYQLAEAIWAPNCANLDEYSAKVVKVISHENGSYNISCEFTVPEPLREFTDMVSSDLIKDSTTTLWVSCCILGIDFANTRALGVKFVSAQEGPNQRNEHVITLSRTIGVKQVTDTIRGFLQELDPEIYSVRH